MKKVSALFISILLYSSNICFAQLGSFVNGSSTYVPPSANASALLQYANVPVNEHTGIASVVLPVDQLAGRQINTPITLSYHGSGIKVQDIASNVGLGFVLNAGGVLTRVMRGLPDESSQGYQHNGKRVYSRDVDSVYLNAVINNKVDGEPDIFYFNFMGHTGKLVVDTLGHPQYLPDQGIRVIKHPIHNSADSTQNAWILKDFNGTTYVFGADTSSKELTVTNLVNQPISKAITYISSWYLTQIISPDGKETVNFKYSSGPNQVDTLYRTIVTYKIHRYCIDTRTGIFSSHIRHTETQAPFGVDTTDVSTTVRVLNAKFLSSIQNDIGSVTFSYTPREDLQGGQALNQIKVFNIYDNSTPLKTYTFNEGYFLSPSPANPSEADSKRLRLDCVTLQGRSDEIKQLYSFTYNHQATLPSRKSDEFDHWGYYTSLNSRGSFPPVNLIEENGNYDDGFDVRGSDSVRMQACMLNRIRNLNGGYTNFIYEINKYQYNNKTSYGGGLRIRYVIENDSLGQVIPITKQYLYLLDDGTASGMVYNTKPYYIQGLTNYKAGTIVNPIPSLLGYELNNLKKPLTVVSNAVSIALTIAGISSPVGLAVDIGVSLLAPAVGDAFAFLFKRTHKYTADSPPFVYSSAPLNNLFDINGASVTYSQVEAINGDGGKTVDYYTSQQEYPDSTSSVILNCFAKPVKAAYGNAGAYPPSTSFDFERGLLKRSLLFDSNNKLVSSTTNTYQLSNRVTSVTGQRPFVNGYATLADNTLQVITYNVGIYNEVAENIQLTKTSTQLFDQADNGNSITNSTSYSWEPDYPTLMRSQSTYRSDGNLLVNYTTYPMDYPSGTPFLDDMKHHNLLASPIEQVNTLVRQTGPEDLLGTYITGGVVNRFKAGGLGLPDTTFTVNAAYPISLSNFKFSNQLKGIIGGNNQPYHIDGSYTAKAFYQAYNSKNDLVQSQNFGEPSSSTIWGYNQDVPIAKITNATADKVAYTSFETNDQQYWSFTASGRDSSGLAKTGKVRYQLSAGNIATHNSIPAGTYIVSLWTQGAKPTISGASTDVSIVNGESDDHGWNFYMDRITLSGSATISLSGGGLVDEVRLYPQGAHMSTTTVTPQVGVSSTNSPDDKVNTYEYDHLLRIITERDDQFNILKKYSYSNVAALACGQLQDVWTGIDPICYTDQTGIVPDTAHYSAIAANSYGNLICNILRDTAETGYMAKVNFTVTYSDSTDYTTSTLIKQGEQSSTIGLPLIGKTAESVKAISVDSVINLSDDYGVSYQKFTNRKRVRDNYTEANTPTGGLGPYIPPVRSSTGCALLFTNKVQTGFAKNDCSTGNGSIVDYTVAAGLYSATSQAKADSMARAAGQAYANAHGDCSYVDTTFVGIDSTCVTSTADSGSPDVADYSIGINYIPQFYTVTATLTRTTGAAAHDATVTYALSFTDGTSASYTTPFYKGQSTITISPPLGGYGPNNVRSISISNVVYSGLHRQAFTNRKRLLNGVPDGYTETNTAGNYYLAPLADPGACDTWFYNTAQTGFIKNDCPNGPGSAVSYTVPAHSDSSTVSLDYANALARIRGQSYANANGTCYVDEPMVTTVAGNGQFGDIDGSVGQAEFGILKRIAVDQNNNVYIPDDVIGTVPYPRIRKISVDGTVSIQAGTDELGYANGIGSAAKFSGIEGISTDVSGNVYVCDAGNYRIRKITPGRVVTTLAGNGTYGYADGRGTAAKFSSFLTGMSIASNGDLYVADALNYRIRKITSDGLVSTVAGNGTNNYLDGPVDSAEFTERVNTVAFDNTSGIIYLAEHGRIRKIANGMVTTFAGDGTEDMGLVDGTGTAARFGFIAQMAIDAKGNIYVADAYNSAIRKVTPAAVVTTLAGGTGDLSLRDGPTSIALFYEPFGIAIDIAGDIYVSDTYNNVIRKITFPKH
ncbi:DUF5977 domain-containing protein [Mucilaginibacter panaciglaebae]|uniref:DUF5977 domain-containing protein n=1 Tax=Mucilaginibacter panaciglaebae TaxID=502331 RepID=UPI0031E83D5F